MRAYMIEHKRENFEINKGNNLIDSAYFESTHRASD